MRIREITFWHILFFLIFLNAGSLVWAAISGRPLYADGVYFYFWLIENKNFYWHVYFWRFLVAVLQAPSVLILNLFPNSDTNQISSMILNFSMSLHPMVSLYFSYKILKRFNQMVYFVFPVLAYALCCQSLMPYASLSLPESMSLFWPLFLLLVFRKYETKWDLAVLFLCSIGLFFSYEVSIVFFAVNLFALLLKAKFLKVSCTSDYFFAFIQVMGIGFMGWRITTAASFTKDRFFEAARTGDIAEDPYRIVGFGILLFFLLMALLLCKFKDIKKNVSLLFFLFTLAMVFYFFQQLYGSPSPVKFLELSYYQRTTAGLVSAAFACILLLLFVGRVEVLSKAKHGLAWMNATACLVLFLSFAQDLVQTSAWRRTTNIVHRLSESNPGCNVLASNTEKSVFANNVTVPNWFLPLLTMRVDQTLRPSSVFYVEDPPTGKVCQLKENHFGNMAGYFENSLKRFDFSDLLKGPIRIHEWDEATQSLKSRLIQRETR